MINRHVYLEQMYRYSNRDYTMHELRGPTPGQPVGNSPAGLQLSGLSLALIGVTYSLFIGIGIYQFIA